MNNQTETPKYKIGDILYYPRKSPDKQLIIEDWTVINVTDLHYKLRHKEYIQIRTESDIDEFFYTRMNDAYWASENS